MSNLTDKTVIHKGRFLTYAKRENGWEFVERNNVSGIVGIVAVTPDRKMLVISHVSPPHAKEAYELPAGLAGDTPGQEDESLPTAAARELMEETGYEATELKFLCHGATSAGMSNEVVSLYRAIGVKKIAAGGGVEGENITVHEVPLDSAVDWLAEKIKAGCVVDMKIYAALYFATH